MSTLRPGQVSPVIEDLRNAALKEMDATPPGESKVEGLKFDEDHAKSPPPLDTDFDNNNGVSQYPGQNSEHIGNGTGGVRGR